MNSHIRLNKAHRRSYNAAISRGERIADLWIPYPGGMKAAVAQKGSNKTVFSRGIMVELGNSYTGKSFFEIYQGVKLKPDPASAAAAAQGAAIRNTRMLHNASDALKVGAFVSHSLYKINTDLLTGLINVKHGCCFTQ
jgi:hypothetical protein